MHIYRWRAAALAAPCLAVALLGLNPATQSQAAESPQPVAVYGPLPDGATSVELTVLPPFAAAAQSGQPVALEPLEDVDVILREGSFSAAVDPADISVDDMSAEGVVNFRVDISGPNDQHWVSVLSSRAVYMPSASEPTWADPVESAHAAQVAARAERAAVGRSHIPRLVATDSDPNVGEPEFEDDGTAASEAASSPCRHVQYQTDGNAETTRSATIGTTYPVGNSTARMEVDHSEGAKYGAAFQAIGDVGFTASGEIFTKTGWGKAWVLSGAQRSYRKGILYHKFINHCMDEGPSRYWTEPWWYPIGETGGTAHNDGLTRPSWNSHCDGVDAGPWWRNSGSGAAYKYGASVKFAGMIGIDLSITRDYSSNQKLYYNVVGNKTKLCGSNAMPSMAGKIIQRFK